MTEPSPTHVPADYTVVRHLGSGQTAHVFLARHARRGNVALKLPREELGQQPVLRRMFENEVQITMGLQHRNVVAGLEGMPTGNLAYLVLEYCSGGTLGDLLAKEGQLPLDVARRLIIDVAKGLEHAHLRQVLHRDVKPANVFLTSDGTAKLGDLGTGIHIGDESGERVGTAFYMAPEIFEGQQPTVRSDVYSLGILAYEVLAGERPFSGESYEDLMLAHLSGFPKALANRREELGKAEAKVVAVAMSRDPARRYASVREFREAFMGAAGITEASKPAAPLTGRASRTAKRPEPEGENGKGDKQPGGSGVLGWFRRKRED